MYQIRLLLSAFYLTLLLLLNIETNAQESADYGINELKAIYTLNIGRYIEWANESTSTEIEIAIVGDKSFYETILKFSSGKRIRNKKVDVHYYEALAGLDQKEDLINLLYISETLQLGSEELNKLKGQYSSVLVGEQSNFAKNGGCFNFFEEKGKLKFEFNLRNLQNGDYKIQPKLLQKAILVNDYVGNQDLNESVLDYAKTTNLEYCK